MNEPIKPALTPEEWAEFLSASDMARLGLASILLVEWNHGKRPALAAVALYGQPFGWTREDVDLLRQIASARTHLDAQTGVGIAVGESVADWLSHLADRIAALLPPEPV